jgi:hypothetical protein
MERMQDWQLLTGQEMGGAADFKEQKRRSFGKGGRLT